MSEALRQAVLNRLALLDQMAEKGSPTELLPFVRTELQRLADGWRLLLTVHEPTADGRCKACPTSLFGRRRRWPCRLWLTAHRHLLNDGIGHRERRLARRKKNPTRTVPGNTAAEPVASAEPQPKPIPAESPMETTTQIPQIRLTLPSELDPRLFAHFAKTTDRTGHESPDENGSPGDSPK